VKPGMAREGPSRRRWTVPRPRSGDDGPGFVRITVRNDLRHRFAVSRAALPLNGWLNRFAGICFLCVLLIALFTPARLVSAAVPWVGLLAFVSLLFSGFQAEWTALAYRETPLLSQPRLVHEVARNGITSYARDDAIVQPWEEFRGARETSHFFLLQRELPWMTLRSPWLGLPKDRLTKSETETLRRLLTKALLLD
jgi:hypothetical protein